MNRRRFLTTAAALPLAGCLRVSPTNTSASEEDFTALSKTVAELMAEFSVPGASMACVRAGHLAWARCFGIADVSSQRPVDEKTLFEAASVSKTVFAYAALKLCEQGVIGLDTPLVRYTREPFLDDPRIEKITPRQLLSHSSGLAEWRSRDNPLIESEPGTRFQYSGEGYYYLQSTLTELLGKTDSSQCAKVWNVRDWRRQYGPTHKPLDAPVPETPEELKREIQQLRKELARVTTQRDILKKTMGILSEP